VSAATRKAPRRAARKAGRGKPPDPARVAALLRALKRHDPDPRCALDYAAPYELICSVILSAQCTDKRVNLVTPALFARYPDAAALAAARQADVEELVRTTGFFRNKARNLIGMARGLVERFGGRVPRGMDELLSLPGVARKTANVVRGEVYGLADGVVVDTHVTRLAFRLGLTRHTDPVKIERDLMTLLPREEWIGFSHRLIRLGRTICVARKPRCGECPLTELCPKVGVKAAG
jgi:endonuclease III